MLEKANRLSEIQTDKDIKSLSKAQFPGPHCPLFGAVMTASYVEDLRVLVIGTEECTYYGKDFAMMRREGKDNVYSAVLEQQDITFGCEEELRAIIRKIEAEDHPKALMVVTTCVVELIGEDVYSILHSMREEVSMKLLVVKTEHFKCGSHIEGIERSLEQLYLLMEAQSQKERKVNILGFKYEGIEETELYQLLTQAGVEVAMTIPTKVSIAALEKAPSSQLNIVVEPTALKLAQKMEESFDIPYINFCGDLNVEKVEANYRYLGDYFDFPVEAFIQAKTKQLDKALAEAKAKLAGKGFIYGNTPFDCFEFSYFLMTLGMEPLVIQCRELREQNRAAMAAIFEQKANPFVVRMANIAPLRRLYSQLKPAYYFGHESPMVLSEHGIIQVVTDKCAKKIGFEQIGEVVESILEEKGIMNLMGSAKLDQQAAIRDKIQRLTKMPGPMKKLLLNMKEIPEQMGDAILALKDDESIMSMMKMHKNGQSMGRM